METFLGEVRLLGERAGVVVTFLVYKRGEMLSQHPLDICYRSSIIMAAKFVVALACVTLAQCSPALINGKF